MIYVFFGSDYGLTLEKAKEALKKQMVKKGIDAAVKYDAYSSNIADVVAECQSLSLFDNAKVVLYTNCYFLSSNVKTQKGQFKESQQDYNGFLEYLKSPEESSDLFLVANSTLDSKNDIVKALKELPAIFTNCTEMSEEDYISYAMRKAKDNGKDIDRPGAKELYLRTSYKENYKSHGNYMLFNNELEKLMLYTDHIRQDDVKLLIHRPLEDNFFEAIKLVLAKKPDEAISIYKDVRTSGTNVFMILPGITAVLKNYALLKYHFEKGTSQQDIASELQIKNPNSLYFKKKELQYISYQNLLKALLELSDIERDVKFKGDDADERMYLFFSLFQRKYLSR